MWLANATYLNEEMQFVAGDILINASGVIETIEPAGTAGQPGKAEKLDCYRYLLLPGLVNAHFHTQSTLLRGLNVGLELNEWGKSSPQGDLQNRVFRYLDEQVTGEEFRIICLKDLRDLLRQGITFCADSGTSEHPSAYGWVAAALREIGMRGVVDSYEHFEEVAATAPDRSNYYPYTAHLPEEEDITEERLNQATRLMEKFNPIFMTHSLETAWRRDKVMSEWGQSSIELFARRGLLGPKVVLFHGVHTTDRDIELVREAGATLVHCPISNLSAGEVAPTAKWLAQGLNIALGTDWARVNLWEVMRIAFFLLKQQGGRQLGKAEDILRMATSNGAKAFQQGERLGKIKLGYCADLTFLDKTNPALLPLVNQSDFSNVGYNLLMEGQAELVQHVMVNGQWIIKDKKLLTVDEEELEKNYLEIVEKIFAPN